MSELLATLNPEQRRAAVHFEGPMLVLAGAGSGKTRVLTARVAHLIEEYGVAPEAILSLTFTNKAAGEMRERVRRLLGGREPAGMWTGTFHSAGARILRRYAIRLGWPPGFSIYDADDSETLVRRVVVDVLNLDPKRWSPKAIRGAISSAKNELVGPEEYAASALDPFSRRVAEVYALYQERLRDASAFDFDDLLVKPVELLRQHRGVLEAFRDRFRFVLVDEYQDTNRAQYLLLRLLADEHRNLFVVGDDDQSIYGWRGADIRNILDFENDFPGATVVRLEQNYRSSRTILEAANEVISHNQRRKGKRLFTAADRGERVTLAEAADEGDEAGWISTEVELRCDRDGKSPRDFAVLYRTNAQSRALEEAMRRRGLPYRVVGGVRFYERREVKDVLAYLRLAANPASDDAFLRAARSPRRGLGDASLARLAGYASERGLSLLAAAGEEGVAGVRGPAASALPTLAALIAKHAGLAAREARLDEQIRALVEEAGLVESLRREGPEGEERVRNVDELIAGAAEIQERLDADDPELLVEAGEAGGRLRALDLFLAQVALVTDIDQHDAGADAVTLMTLHNAKGLEFPLVFVAGLEDGLFPLSRTFDDPDALEEERRLFYVGITRAREKLYLTYARRRRRAGQWQEAAPSCFLDAVPGALVDTRQTPAARGGGFAGHGRWRGNGFTPRRARLGLRAPPPTEAGYTVDYADSQEVPCLSKGARVRHPRFGPGTVAELAGAGADVKAAIDFDEVGRKKVVVRYANLQSE
ncbi:MAG: ATP-dependent helicase [Longimicrobiaceae bacterium]